MGWSAGQWVEQGFLGSWKLSQEDGVEEEEGRVMRPGIAAVCIPRVRCKLSKTAETGAA